MSAVLRSGRDKQNPIMTFQIKKIINSELFIYGKQKLYLHKGRIKKWSEDLLKRGKQKLASDDEVGENELF